MDTLNFNSNLSTVICTDAGPDDVAAIALLLPVLSDVDILLVVGEHSNVQEKAMVLEWALCEIMGVDTLTGVTIRCGRKCSDATNLYPVPLHFHQMSEVPALLSPEELGSFIGDLECNIFSLKPPRDLWQAYERESSIFGNCHLYSYGSFNLRTMLNKRELSSEQMIQMLSSFQDTVIYESFPVLGQKNAVTKDDGIQNYCSGLQQVVDAWNEHMYSFCEAKLDADRIKAIVEAQSLDIIPTTDPRYRNYKVWWRIYENSHYNLLLSDLGLILFLLHPVEHVQVVPVTITFAPDTFYTVATPSEGSSIQYLFGDEVNKESIRNQLIQLVKQYLHQ